MMSEIIPSFNQVGPSANYAPALASDREVLRNAKAKIYPHEIVVTVCDRSVYHVPGYEEIKPIYNPPLPDPEDDMIDAERQGKLLNDGLLGLDNIQRAVRRARSKVYDLAMCTPSLSYFVTLTLSPDTVDRYDPNTIIPKLSTWLRNRAHRKGLSYILVPERHKDGAIHFHGLINDALQLVPSGTYTKNGSKPRKPRSDAQLRQWLKEGYSEVYNIPDWKMGYTTAIPLYGERENAVKYVLKYIGKDLNEYQKAAPRAATGSGPKIGGRYYYSGGELIRPQELLFNYDLRDLPDNAQRFTIAATGDTFYTYSIPT